MEDTNCILCGETRQQPLFSKESRQGESFRLVRCPSCGLQYLSPRPDENEIAAYYSDDYFTRRDDRGYNNYLSDEVRAEIERVFALNLKDLGFFDYEDIYGARRCLDVGCAAGYFVEYMRKRGWDAQGIDVAGGMVRSAKERGLSVEEGSYLTREYDEPFRLITLWATIEHLHHPERFIEKIERDLVPGGMLYISTCRVGGFNFMRLFGRKWRFYNFPEHLVFFSIETLRRLLVERNFTVSVVKTYGSGVGTGGSLRKRIADWMAKYLGLGDMMIIAARKKGSCA